ncbi:winged helix-turn-helix domain-containing protein [Thermomonospora cellulosilytica]|uniref:OmpR/PhoB-type domain-containing protein n=1 Tax=Thermomonospora cellulosilytica TaxID=1411118 RepID=A0A7W3MY55_9ACTN|nr:winged helix-turn-helix domain-containing protein [Thermomonospora cellulosilytica]MBA9004013.1 hypothetical protein [Thermomonospora cellulosilytica]
MGVDSALRSRRAVLQREWASWLEGAGRLRVRAEIADSWRRSIRAVDPARPAAPVDDEADRRWPDSPLHDPVLAVSDELRTVAEDAGFVAAVTDESGTILWTCGGRVMRRRAEAVSFVPGGRWDEQSMGTNALSLALRTGRPHSVFSAEHLVQALHGWVCYCAPIHGPDGRVLGVLDISTTWDRSHPLGLPTVRGLVSAIEGRLATRLGRGGLIQGRAGWRLDCLGGAELLHGGAPVRLRPRQMEILTLLVLEGRALSPERLYDALYGERRVSVATLKAEVSHLRRALRGALSVRRYELTEDVGCDAVDVLRALRAGRLDEALDAYRGPLLPESDAPGIAGWREHIDVALREAVLRDPRPEPALRYGELHPEDLAVHEHALSRLGPGDARRGVALARHRAALSG